MEYNTTRETMIIPEYGRNIQKMIQYLCTIEDREKRTKAATFIISVMAQMHQSVKESADFKHKLWDHMYIISDFKLDVDAPYPPPPPLSNSLKPEHISYHNHVIKYRHYGKIIPMMIEKATEYPEGPEKDSLVQAIANQMKKSYLNWNRESVTDEFIENQLFQFSGGRLKLHEDARLTHTDELLGQQRQKKYRPFRSNPGGKYNHKNRNKPQ